MPHRQMSFCLKRYQHEYVLILLLLVHRSVMGKEYEVRHILLKLNPLLNDAQAKVELERIRSDIISGKMTFADAALKYSKDYLSGANGGSLGYAFTQSLVASCNWLFTICS